MPLFNCSKCNCVENTACGYYWRPKSQGEPALCSECKDGVWHGEFPKKSAEGMLVDKDGCLWHSYETPPPHLRKFVGTIAADGSVTPLPEKP